MRQVKTVRLRGHARVGYLVFLFCLVTSLGCWLSDAAPGMAADTGRDGEVSDGPRACWQGCSADTDCEDGFRCNLFQGSTYGYCSRHCTPDLPNSCPEGQRCVESDWQVAFNSVWECRTPCEWVSDCGRGQCCIKRAGTHGFDDGADASVAQKCPVDATNFGCQSGFYFNESTGRCANTCDIRDATDRCPSGWACDIHSDFAGSCAFVGDPEPQPDTCPPGHYGTPPECSSQCHVGQAWADGDPCPDGWSCYVPGDVSGYCVANCDPAGERCAAGFSCEPLPQYPGLAHGCV